MKKLLLALWLLSLSLPPAGLAAERFIEKLTLPTGETVVVAEGDFEARSIGSFSVRLYDAAPAPDETTFFRSGLIHLRDGVLEKIILADVDGDNASEIIVIARSAGTGGYLSVYGFTVNEAQLAFHSAAEGLPADADPVAALKNSGMDQK